MDLEKLNAFLDKSGFSKSDIAAKLGLSRASLYKKLSGETAFSSSEISRLAVITRMTAEEIFDIFFTEWVSKFANSKKEMI